MLSTLSYFWHWHGLQHSWASCGADEHLQSASIAAMACTKASFLALLPNQLLLAGLAATSHCPGTSTVITSNCKFVWCWLTASIPVLLPAPAWATHLASLQGLQPLPYGHALAPPAPCAQAEAGKLLHQARAVLHQAWGPPTLSAVISRHRIYTEFILPFYHPVMLSCKVLLQFFTFVLASRNNGMSFASFLTLLQISGWGDAW